MALGPRILFAKVMHKRLTPKINAFTYSIYYIACPLSRLHEMQGGFRFGVERPGLLSFYAKDHGPRDGSDLELWLRDALGRHGIDREVADITLITMPRVLGYVFNPVSFWLCRTAAGALRAVLCEVNNTFGETHSYLCAHADGRAIEPGDWLEGEKFFHVSPFIQREGHYRFRFAMTDGSFGVWINHTGADGQPLLLTALTGHLAVMDSQSLSRAFWGYPLMTLRAVTLIHWQAVKLLAKGVRYVRKPLQRPGKLTATADITEL